MTQSRIMRTTASHANALAAAASLLGLALGCHSVEASDEATALNNGQPAVSHQTKLPAASNQWKHYAPTPVSVNQKTIAPGSVSQKETIAASSVHQKETIAASPGNQTLSPGAANQLKWNTSAPPSRDPRAAVNPQPLPPRVLPPPKNPPKFP